jgi:hypothetical protein
MKKLIEKIQKYFYSKKISKMIMEDFLFDFNDRETREKIRVRLNKMMKTELRDATDPDLVQSGGMRFRGYSSKRKKEINIIINTQSTK